MEWMRYFKGKVRYAVLIKTNQWPPKKKKNVAGKGKGEADIAAAPANLQGKGKAVASASKRKVSEDDNGEDAQLLPAIKRTKSKQPRIPIDPLACLNQGSVTTMTRSPNQSMSDLMLKATTRTTIKMKHRSDVDVTSIDSTPAMFPFSNVAGP